MMDCTLLQFIQPFSVHPKMAASQLNASSGRSASLAQSGVLPPKRVSQRTRWEERE